MAGSGSAHLREGAVLTVRDLVVEFPAGGERVVHAVSGVSFDLLKGETLGIVGESGCGKSTTGRAVVQLIRPNAGTVALNGTDLGQLDGEDLRQARVGLQMVFQDPVSSLNPRHRITQILEAPLRAWDRGTGEERQQVVRQAMDAVGLDPEVMGTRRPKMLSGGQCQRVSIARALVTRPEVLVCDEAVSALDVSVQAQILNLLVELKEEYRLTMIFISHDLGVVQHISDRVLVMYLGKVCEVAPSKELFERPRHRYSRALIDAIPVPHPRRYDEAKTTMSGEVPSPIDPPAGCRVWTRCPAATDVCRTVEPELVEMGEGHFVACHHPIDY